MGWIWDVFEMKNMYAMNLTLVESKEFSIVWTKVLYLNRGTHIFLSYDLIYLTRRKTRREAILFKFLFGTTSEIRVGEARHGNLNHLHRRFLISIEL